MGHVGSALERVRHVIVRNLLLVLLRAAQRAVASFHFPPLCLTEMRLRSCWIAAEIGDASTFSTPSSSVKAAISSALRQRRDRPPREREDACLRAVTRADKTVAVHVNVRREDVVPWS